jgi:hypothetical protein
MTGFANMPGVQRRLAIALFAAFGRRRGIDRASMARSMPAPIASPGFSFACRDVARGGMGRVPMRR